MSKYPEIDAVLAGETDGCLQVGNAVDLLAAIKPRPHLIVTDPPYAFSGCGPEHQLTATVAVVLRESARLLRRDSWMLVFCAASWRSTAYMADALRGVVVPVRIGRWCKPVARTRVKTGGWQWAGVNVLVLKKGRPRTPAADIVDHIVAEPLKSGRRAELPPVVADWAVRPYAVPGGLLLDPFAGSGALLAAGQRAGMRHLGFELQVAAARGQLELVGEGGGE